MRAPLPHPVVFKLLIASAVATALLPAAPARAEPVSFYSAGTVGVTILQSGLVQDVGMSDTDWLGRTVAGMVVSDADDAPSYPALVRPRYSRAEIFPYTGWMSLSVLQPDGSLATLPAAALSRPAAEEDDAFTLLLGAERRDWFHVRRGGGEGPVAESREAFALALRALDPVEAMPFEADFRTLTEEPDEAERKHLTRAYDPDGRGEEQALARAANRAALATSQLPEPSGLALCASGLLVVAALFRRADCN